MSSIVNNKHPENLVERVSSFIAETIGEPLVNVHLTSRIEEDLGVTGLDAEDLLMEFTKEFNVNLSNIDFHKHFAPEGSLPVVLLMLHHDFGKYPITVEHLCNVVKSGYWFEPPQVIA